MNIIYNLNFYIHCYNYCKFHDKYEKEKMLENLENDGFRFVKYKGKIYLSDIIIKNKNFTNHEINILKRLAFEIKEINAKKDESLIYKAKEYGLYFKN